MQVAIVSLKNIKKRLHESYHAAFNMFLKFINKT